MKRICTALLIAAMAAPFAVLTACSETLYERQQSKSHIDGSHTYDKTTVRQNPDGTTTTDTDRVHVRD